MVIRNFKEQEYKSFYQHLMTAARLEPMEASCTVDVVVNGAEYRVRLQPGRHNRMAVLQAQRVRRDKGGGGHELITHSKVCPPFWSSWCSRPSGNQGRPGRPRAEGGPFHFAPLYATLYAENPP